MSLKIFLIILGMAIVTYIPRLVPFYIVSKMNLSKRATLFLKCIPYSALGALIIPDTFTAIADNSLASIAGTIGAVLIAYFSKNTVITVIGSIIIVYMTIVLL